MSSPKNAKRMRLIEAAIKLFAAQGVTATTTKQIAELAQVNEVTLFRHFGSKHGLLLAVMKESGVLTDLSQTLLGQSEPSLEFEQTIKNYALSFLQILEQVPEVVRSLIGEAGQYPAENRKALGDGLTQVNRDVARSLDTALAQSQRNSSLSSEQLASLLNALVLGYAAVELTTEFHQLWQGREDFLDNLVTLFLSGTATQSVKFTEQATDLPASLVHLLLQQAKKLGLQEYALVYVLFSSGLTPAEICTLERSHYISHSNGQFLQITQGYIRQVPLNQWILGRRYGSYTRNPLTRWLKSRKDQNPRLLITSTGDPISEAFIKQRWQEIVEGIVTPLGQTPIIEQTQATWCVEMFTRGLSLEEMQFLTGWDLPILQFYAHRAKEQAVLEKAIRCDHKSLS